MKLVALGFAVFLFWCGEAKAASADAEVSWPMLFLHIGNFAFLLFIIYKFAGGVVVGFFQRRSENIRAQIDKAQQLLQNAEAELAELRERVAGFEAEEQRIAQVSADQGEFDKRRMIERARETAERIRQDAARVADQEVDRARQELREEAAQLATELANELLRDNLTPEDDQRLVREFVGQIGRSS